MKIRGKEIQFLRTVKATCEIARLCPEENIERIGELFDGTLSNTIEVGAKLIHYLNEGYEMNKHFDDPSYKPNIISIEEIMFLSEPEFVELMKEAMEGINVGTETTIETIDDNNKKKETE